MALRLLTNNRLTDTSFIDKQYID